MRSLLLSSLFLLIGQASVTQACPGTASPSFCNLNQRSYPDWMARLPDGRSIAELSIPGTHESLAILGGGLSECQENNGESAQTLTAQLNAGIRAFDIRLRITDGGKFTIHHASQYQNANFDDVLTKLGDFLGSHKSETVLLRLKRECQNKIPSCTDAAGDFETIFRSYVQAYSSLFWSPAVQNGNADVPKLGDVRGKAVLAVLTEQRGGRYPAFGLAQFSGWSDKSSEYVQDEYTVPDVGAIATKRDQVRRFLDMTSAGDKTKIYFNFCSGSSAGAYPWTVAGGSPPVIGVNTFLLGYLGEGEDVHPKVVRTGAMMMDYPGPDLIEKIISINNFYSC